MISWKDVSRKAFIVRTEADSVKRLANVAGNVNMSMSVDEIGMLANRIRNIQQLCDDMLREIGR